MGLRFVWFVLQVLPKRMIFTEAIRKPSSHNIGLDFPLTAFSVAFRIATELQGEHFC